MFCKYGFNWHGYLIISFRSPAIAGGLFTMRKDFFLKTGKYDEEMEIWGPDNVELSLRVRKKLIFLICSCTNSARE